MTTARPTLLAALAPLLMLLHVLVLLAALTTTTATTATAAAAAVATTATTKTTTTTADAQPHAHLLHASLFDDLDDGAADDDDYSLMQFDEDMSAAEKAQLEAAERLEAQKDGGGGAELPGQAATPEEMALVERAAAEAKNEKFSHMQVGVGKNAVGPPKASDKYYKLKYNGGDGVTATSITKDIYVIFGGWSSLLVSVKCWAMALTRRLAAVNKAPSYLYPVKGPEDSLYLTQGAHEIPTEKLAKDVLAHMEGEGGPIEGVRVVVLAHSSGAFVAHEFFDKLVLAGYKGKQFIEYFNLDGDGYGFRPEHHGLVRNLYAVSAKCGQIESPGTKPMALLAAAVKENAEPEASPTSSEHVVLVNNKAGCEKPLCVHELPVITVPHNKRTFILKQDYCDFDAEHPLASKFIEERV